MKFVGTVREFKAWTVDKFGVPHAPTDKPPYTARCEETCGVCKERVCSKANGHAWSCNCHFTSCAPQYNRTTGAVTYGRKETR